MVSPEPYRDAWCRLARRAGASEAPVDAAGRGAPTLLAQRLGKAVAGGGGPWRQRERTLEMRHRLGGAALGGQQPAEAEFGVGERRLQGERLPVARLGLAPLALRLLDPAETVVGLGQRRVECQRLPLTGECLAVLAHRAVRLAQIAKIGSRVRPQRDRLGDQPDRLVRPPRLQGDHPQEVQGLGVIGRAR